MSPTPIANMEDTPSESIDVVKIRAALGAAVFPAVF